MLFGGVVQCVTHQMRTILSINRAMADMTHRSMRDSLQTGREAFHLIMQNILLAQKVGFTLSGALRSSNALCLR